MVPLIPNHTPCKTFDKGDSHSLYAQSVIHVCYHTVRVLVALL